MAAISQLFITLADLAQAYRKAKADVFFERSQPFAVEFASYEMNLVENLEHLRDQLTDSGANWYDDITFIGKCGFLPKGMDVPKRKQSSHGHFTDSRAANNWKRLLAGRIKPTAKFRPVAHFTVDMYVVCALWVNLIGHKFDECCSSHARGSRLRRYYNPENPKSKDASRPYHIDAVGSFQPYFEAYRSWRGDGLRAIKECLKDHEPVIAITMDLTGFYHNIDPSFILKPSFLDESGYSEKFTGLSDSETALTEGLIKAFRTWSLSIPDKLTAEPIGVPVGPSASRVFANTLLCPFDRQIVRNLSPIYYGRYVDDIFLVLRDPTGVDSASKLVTYLTKKLRTLKVDKNGDLQLNVQYAGESRLIFKRDKQRIFLLAGRSGIDLVENIESKINEVSSEWRLLPNIDDLESLPSAKALTTGNDVTLEVDALRKADVLSIRRLGFSLMLRSCHAAAEDLPNDAWVKERHRFYRFAIEHVLNPLRVLDLHDYIPRLFSLAVTCSDWTEALLFVEKLRKIIGMFREQGLGVSSLAWNAYVMHTYAALLEALAKAIPFESSEKGIEAHLASLLSEIAALGPEFSQITPSAEVLLEQAGALRRFDLSNVPFKLVVRQHVGQASDELLDSSSVRELFPDRAETILQFLSEAKLATHTLRPLLFPTRPFTTAEISELVPNCIKDLARWCQFATAMRGTCPQPISPPSSRPSGDNVIRIGEGPRPNGPTIALPSILVEESTWCQAAANKPDLSLARYSRLMAIANGILQGEHKPDYVLFPELSIPRRWASRIAGHFTRARISVVAGLEYRFDEHNHVINEAKLYLTDNRLGYPTHCVITQPKVCPAPHEMSELRSSFGLTFATVSGGPKSLYNHYGFAFGVLICSELTNIDNRQTLRGQVDATFVLSWNKDLESFASLVDSSALDSHCFVVLVNNRKYGDSRVRAPYRESWLRDAVRVKGGLDDFFVVTRLDTAGLREFHSHHESPLNGLFKPVPEGFLISDERRVIPGGRS